MAVKKETKDKLQEEMEAAGIVEEDILEKFILGSGKGGQKVNKSSSCVYLKHLPTGFEVKCQESRSRDLNRFLARRLLVERIQEEVQGIQSAKQQQYEKVRRQKRRRSRRMQAKVLEEKKRHSTKKVLRQAPQE